MWSRGRRLSIGVLAAILLLMIGGRVAAEVLVEFLWYRSVEAERVFWLRWGAGLGIRAVVALLAGGVVFLNLWVVSRSLGPIRVRRRFGNLEIAEQLPRFYVVGAISIVALLSAWWLSGGISNPVAVLAAFDHESWGVRDPYLGRDVSFYVFVLPLLSGAQALAGILVFWCALLVAASYLATGTIRVHDGRLQLTPGARRHLGALLVAFLLVLAADAWLDRYHLLIGGTGVGDAFGYADARARMPGKTTTAVLALLAALAAGLGAWRDRRRPVVFGVAALVLGFLVAEIVYPTLLQKLAVEPNEFPRERAYIERHVAATRAAYGLGAIDTVALPYAAPAQLDEERVRHALDGVPLWDERPLLVAFRERQSLFPYYDFLSAHHDRYGPEGAAEQVAIGVRELEPAKLAPAAQTWQNLHLTYVSGQGAVVSPVSRMSDDGVPVYYLSNLSPPVLATSAPEALRLTEPGVFFGERTEGYVILDTERRPRGVVLDAAWKRLVFAWAFQSKNLFLSDDIGPESRIVYRRAVAERARAVAPFLHFDPEAGGMPVIHEGRVVWLLDGYTLSDAYPLARPSLFLDRPVRHVRNSAKVVVDGVTGAVAVYALGADPMLRTYARQVPGLVRPISELPPGLVRHLRYPASLMTLQAQALTDYHMADARAFYEKEDAWAIATENYRSEMLPADASYAMLELPGETGREFLLSLPLVARGRQNLTGLYVTRNDPPHYGEQRLFLLPRDQQIPGPQQVEAMIDQDPEISQELALWRRGGSNVIRGHMIVVPVDGTLLYVEPVYLEAETSAIPQLERVIVARAGRVVMRPTLESAVTALLGVSLEEPAAEGEGEGEDPAAAGAPEVPEALARVRALFERAETQLRAGDWAGFGRTWEAIREALPASEPPVRPPG